MPAAVALMLEGMPSPRDLHLHRAAGRVVVLVGSRLVAEYGETDLAMRNMVIVTLRRLGFPGWRVAEVFGLTPTYVSRLRTAASRQGAAALAGQDGPGRPRALGEDQQDLARQWREQGESDLEIGRRLGVAGTTVARRLAARPAAGADGGPRQEEPGFAGPAAGPGRDPEPADPRPEPGLRADSSQERQGEGEPGGGAGPGGPAGAAPDGAGGGPLSPPPGPGGPEITGGVFWSRYAGAMLLHAFTARAGAGQVLESAAGAGRGAGGYRFADVALLSVTSMCFALGAQTTEQVKHLTASCAGPLAGLAVLPHLRTLRPRLAAVADAADPLALQEMAARAMLAADPVTSGVYYVDDHFVPYAGAKPVGKGWNNKRGKAERGRADTHVTAHDGRAVCFVTGEPSGLTVTLPKALAELTKAAGPGAAIMLGFDRGGAYPQVFRHCREQGVHWVTYRRAPLAVPARLPVITTITRGGKARQIAWAEETVQIKDYGQARQITLFEHGQVALQVLTSDFDACPAQILAWLKSRWREENFLKYASQNYGIDKICDYIAGIEANTKIVDNPDRKKASAAVREAEKAAAAAERDLAVLLADPAISPAAKNTRLIPAAQKTIAAAHKKLAAAAAARDKIPAKLPANLIDPEAKVALLRTCRRGLQMVLRLHAHNAEHWLSNQLNAYLQDDDEYRAITRQTIIRGLAGTITYTPDRITVELHRPGAPRVARALTLLIDEINHIPPAMPGDTRPITYQLTAHQPGSNK
jgi:Transposase protein